MKLMALFCFRSILDSSSKDLKKDSFEDEISSLNDWLEVYDDYDDVFSCNIFGSKTILRIKSTVVRSK